VDGGGGGGGDGDGHGDGDSTENDEDSTKVFSGVHSRKVERKRRWLTNFGALYSSSGLVLRAHCMSLSCVASQQLPSR